MRSFALFFCLVGVGSPSWTVGAVLRPRTPIEDLAAPHQVPFSGPQDAPDVAVPFDTSSLIITSLNAHLKSWHSPFAPNGFGIVPATIPTGTIMYHVRPAGPAPSEGLDWFALDAEHSYIFGGHGGDSVMWHFAAARPLRVLYFDGASAAKSAGPIDLQEVLAYNKTGKTPGSGMNDFARYRDLCNWAAPRHIDGFVREESTFEYVQCDFASPAIQLVRGVNITVTVTNETSTNPFPGPPGASHFDGSFEDSGDRLPGPPGGPGDRVPSPPGAPGTPGEGGPGGGRRPGGPRRRGGGSIYTSQTQWLYQRATTWHHQLPDPRVRTHPEYLVTLYDPSYTSLASTVRLPRGEHNLSKLSAADSEAFHDELDIVITAWNSNQPTSGVDWAGVTAAATDRYADHLNELRETLSNRSVESNSTLVIDKVRLVTFAMLMPYISGPEALSVYPTPPTTHERFKALATTADACGGGFTAHMSTTLMTPQEIRIKGALESVLHRLCHSMAHTLGQALEVLDSKPETLSEPKALAAMLAAWEEEVDALMEWLGWPGWVRCDRQCGLDELCYISAPLWNPQPDFEPRCRSRSEFTKGQPGPP